MPDARTNSPDQLDVWLPTDEAIRTRRAVRAYVDRSVPRKDIEEILSLASRSPSGSNIQPWTVRVLMGSAKTRVCDAILRAVEDRGPAEFKAPWHYYPTKWREPFLARRRQLGWALYGLLGIKKGDVEASERFRRKNYEFFGAPVGMIFTLDRDLEVGSWIDLGIFLGHVTISARARGLHTCLQQSFADVHPILRTELGIPDEEVVICGMALGYADEQAPQNALRTERAPVDQFTTFFS